MVKHSVFSRPVIRLGCGLLPGCVLGIRFAAGAGEHLVSAMRMAASSHVSIIGSFSAAVLPFLISAFAVYLGHSVLLIPIAFWKAFFFSYVAFGLRIAWSSAGWLVAGLMLFSACASLPLLCWFWLRHLDGRPFRMPVFCLILGCLLLIGTADYYLIAPFLAGIIK